MRVARELAAELDDQLVALVERERVGVVAGVGQQRRKNVEQIRQSVCAEMAWAKSVRPPLAEERRDLGVQSYHWSSASSATGECASVHFMFVMRPPVAAWAAASEREPSGAAVSVSGGPGHDGHDDAVSA